MTEAHPLMLGLLVELPKPGEQWTRERRDQWLGVMHKSVDFLYPAKEPLQLPPARPGVVDAVRQALDEAPADATGPELAERIKAAAVPAYLREPDPTPIAETLDDPQPEPETPKRPRVGRPPLITLAELDAMPQRVAGLTEQERAAIYGRARGLSIAGIATLVGTTPKAAEKAVYRARRKLRGDAAPKRRSTHRAATSAPIVNEGSVWCPLCRANRTQLHYEQHHQENQREKDRIAAGRDHIAGLAPIPDTSMAGKAATR